MNNFSHIMENARDSYEILVDEITQYLNKVDKKMLPLNVKDAIYFTKKYNILSREALLEIRDTSKGSLKNLSRKYNVPEEEMESFWKMLKDMKENIMLMPQMQSDEERELVLLGQLSKDDLTIDLTTPKGRNATAKVYTPLVIKIVNQHLGKSNMSRSDLMSAGMEGLVGAMNDWDPSKGSPFKTYAGYRINQQILNDINSHSHSLSGFNDYARKQGYSADAISLDGFLTTDKDGEFHQDRLSALGTTDNNVDKDGIWSKIFKLVEDNFKARDVEIFYRTNGFNGYKKEKAKDVAKSFGWSEGRVSQIVKGIVNFLRINKKAIEILADLQESYNESLLFSLWGLNKDQIKEALINDDMFILLEEVNKWSNKNVFVNTLKMSLNKLTDMDAEYIKSVLSNTDFEFLDGSFKKHKKVIMAFLSNMYPSESIAKKTDVSLLEYMIDLQLAWKKHNL